MAINPADFGMPDATTAGVRAGVTLKQYTGPMTITQDGAVIENVIINGTLTIDADNVTVRNSVIQNFSNWGILQTENATNVRIEYNDINGTGSTKTSGLGVGGGSNAAIIGNDIRGMVVGIQLFGAATVKDNYIHDLADTSKNADDRHFDGITLFGGGGNLIEHNTILMPEKNGGTAAVFIKTEFGSIDNVTVKNNLMTGDASYTLYVEDTAKGNITNVLVENNYVERGMYGYFYVTGNNPTIRNNIQWQDGVDPTPVPSSTPNIPSTPSVPSTPSDPVVVTPTPSTPSTPSVPSTPVNSGGNNNNSGHEGSAPSTNYFKGTNGNDVIKGTSGADVMRGMRGNDTYVVNHSSDKVIEENHRWGGNDTVKSSVSFDLAGKQVQGSIEQLVLTGNSSIHGTGNNLANKIVGNSGDNKIAGLGGNDILTGGAGKDTFVFNTLPNTRTNNDKISDFNVRDDTIALDNSIFKAIGADGVLAASAFHIGTAAHDANDRVIYNSKTGALIYDSNGSAAGGAVQFASVSPNLSLTHADFLII